MRAFKWTFFALLIAGLFIAMPAKAESVTVGFFCYDVDSINGPYDLYQEGRAAEAMALVDQHLADGICVDAPTEGIEFTPLLVITKDRGGAIVKGTIPSAEAPVYSILLNRELGAAGIRYQEA